MTRHFGLTKPAVTTGACPLPAPHSAHDTQRDNVIRFPALTSLPDNSRASERELFISDDAGLTCALAVVFSCFVVAMSALLYAGYKLFFLFDLG